MNCKYSNVHVGNIPLVEILRQSSERKKNTEEVVNSELTVTRMSGVIRSRVAAGADN